MGIILYWNSVFSYELLEVVISTVKEMQGSENPFLTHVGRWKCGVSPVNLVFRNREKEMIQIKLKFGSLIVDESFHQNARRLHQVELFIKLIQ